MRVARRIELQAPLRQALEALAQDPRHEARLRQRAQIVLLAAAGAQNKAIAAQVGLDRRQVALWRERFLQGGIAALQRDAPRPGRPARDGGPAALRVPPRPSAGAARRLSVVGLYLSPPEHALVLACDAARPVAPLAHAEPAEPGQRGQAWLRFLRWVDHQAPAGATLLVLADNHASHGHPEVQAWLARQARFRVQLTSAGAGWSALLGLLLSECSGVSPWPA